MADEQKNASSPTASRPLRHYGRGGYGNVTSEAQTDSSPAPIQVFTSPNQTFHSGRGGYGNVQSVDNLATMTPDQYLKEVDDAFEVKKGETFKIGRGGAGNIMVEGQEPPSMYNPNHNPNHNHNVNSSGSGAAQDGDEGFFSRIGRRLSGAARSSSRSPSSSGNRNSSRSKSRPRESESKDL